MSTKIEETQRLTSSVVEIMRDNIGKMLQREERLESLSDSTDQLAADARTFQMRSRDLRRQYCWKNWKLTLMIVGVCLIILAIIIMAIVLSTKH